MGAAAWPDPLPSRAIAPSLLSVAAIVGGPSRTDRIDLGASFVAACVWRHHGYGDSISLPFWSAPQSRIDALPARVGPDFEVGWLDCVAEAALRGRRLLASLRTAEQRVAALKAGARSHLADAMAYALRQPVATARGLGDGIGISSRAALDLLKRLCDAGAMREATGRLAWRAFVVE
jgi:signal transduction histidine kinase